MLVTSCKSMVWKSKCYYCPPIYREGETCRFASHCSFLCPMSVRSSIPQAFKLGTLNQCRAFVGHRLRRWANISPVLGYRVVFDATLNVGQRHRRRASINPGPMSQHSVQGLFHWKKGCIALCWARQSAWPSNYQGVIIKTHISNNISVTGQRREQCPSIEPTLGVWYKRFKN